MQKVTCAGCSAFGSLIHTQLCSCTSIADMCLSAVVHVQDAAHLTTEDLCSIARLGQMLTKRTEGQACSHQVHSPLVCLHSPVPADAC